MGEKSVILEECNAQSLQVKQVTPDLFHFVSSHFSKRKKKSDVVGGLTHCKNHVNLSMFGTGLACVASVSNRVIARKLEQNKG